MSAARSWLTGWRLVGAGLIVMGVAGLTATLLGWYPS